MKIYLIGRPSLVTDGLVEYLQDIGLDANGITTYLSRDLVATEAERLYEVAGRVCYNSFAPGLNLNVTKIRNDISSYLDNLKGQAHGSVYEHGMWTFIFGDVSRIFTHELITHRVGMAKSQESGRYVRLSRNLEVRETPYIPSEIRERLDEKLRLLLQEIFDAEKELGIDDQNFTDKKHITSDLRSWAPNGMLNTIMWSATARTLRQVIEARTALGAEQEIRKVFNRVGEIMLKEAPLVFSDYEVTEQNEWKTAWKKI